MKVHKLPEKAFTPKPEWVEAGHYKPCNDARTEIDLEAVDRFCYWMHERQEIWYRRHVLKEDAPWTNDPILRDYRFTHPIRDIDRVSLYYRAVILTRLEDTRESKVNLLFNTIVFRMFNRPEIWEIIGYIDTENGNVLRRLEMAKNRLTNLKLRGMPLFTGAYTTAPMQTIREHYKVQGGERGGEKLTNAFLVLRYVYSNLDEIYRGAIELADTMAEQLEVFQSIPGIGAFNAYEWACDLCMAERYTGIPMVPWDDDSDTNLGPGARKGLKRIFIDTGNLTARQAFFTLASLMPHFFTTLGYADTMKWTKGVDRFNLRVIEHSLCEFQKYERARTGGTKPRQRFQGGVVT